MILNPRTGIQPDLTKEKPYYSVDSKDSNFTRAFDSYQDTRSICDDTSRFSRIQVLDDLTVTTFFGFNAHSRQRSLRLRIDLPVDFLICALSLLRCPSHTPQVPKPPT